MGLNIDQITEVKRMRYFDKLFLMEDEFNLEQSYHIRMRRLHNRHLHSRGIVWGLKVEPVEGTTKIKITPGMALNRAKANNDDKVSQEIYFTDKTYEKELGEYGNSLAPGNSIDVYIYITVTEVKDYIDKLKGGDAEIHWWEKADIVYSASTTLSEEKYILLAKVTVRKNLNGSIVLEVHPEDRIYSGACGKLALSVDGDESYLSVEGKKFESRNGIQVNSPITKFEGALTARDGIEGGLHIGGISDPGDKNLLVEGKCTIKGNLEVLGTETLFKTQTTLIKDNILTISDGTTTGIDSGIEVDRGEGNTRPQFLWIESAKRWKISGVEGGLVNLGYGTDWETLVGGSFADSLHKHSTLYGNGTSAKLALSIDNKGNVGIGTSLTEKVTVTVNGTVDATKFVGDGSGLTNITPSQWLDSAAPDPPGIYYKGNVGVRTLPSMTDALSVDGTVNATKFIGDGSGLTNIPSSQWLNDPAGIGIYYKNNVGIGTGPSAAERLFVDGTVKASMFAGDGSQLNGVVPRAYNVPLLHWPIYARAVPVATVAVGKSPRCIAFDGKYLWVTNQSDTPTGTVSKIDVYTNTVVKNVAVGLSPYGIAFDGRYIWVANYGGTDLSRIDITSDTESKPISGIQNPRELVYDGRFLWVTCFDVASNQIKTIKRIDIGTGLENWSTLLDGATFGVAFDGMYIWVANPNTGTVSKITTDDVPVVKSISVGGTPRGIAFDGKYIWVANLKGTVNKIDISSDAVLPPIDVGLNPTYVAFDGKYLWVTNVGSLNVPGSQTVSKIDVNSDKPVATVSMELAPRGIAFDGRHIWVANASSDLLVNRVTKI